MGRRVTGFLCALALMMTCMVPTLAVESETQTLRCAVLYDGEREDWRDAYSHLEQSLLLNMTVDVVEVSGTYSLEGYDVLYPDASILKSANRAALREELTEFTAAGGSLFLENAFWNFFPREVIGVSGFVKLDHCPRVEDLTTPAWGEDLAELQTIVTDFATIYPAYTDYDRLSGYDYGYAVIPSTAQILVGEGELGLYTINSYEKGLVFFTNPLLPNVYSVNGFSLESRSGEQVSLANSTASANQLLRNVFAGYVSKQKFGFAAYRVFGVLGRPSVAWEVHLEDLSGMKYNTAEPFIELTKAAGQIPSFTLIRSTYYWLSRLESVSYVLNESEDGGLDYQMDFDESAYSSGTHVGLAGGGFMSLGEIDGVGGSYFADYPEFDQRAYPYVADLNGDGNLDLLCGGADGGIRFYAGTGATERFTVGEGHELAAVEGFAAPVACDVDGDGMWDIISGAADGNLYWFRNVGGFQFEPQGVMLTTGLSGQVFPEVGDWNGDGCLDLMLGSNSGVLRFYPGSSKVALRLSRFRYQDLPCDGIEGTWLSPRMVDFDNDGRMDLAVGTFHGYVARFLQNDAGTLDFAGYITADEPNYKGNHNLKFGNNCVPFFVDLNGDGALDLLVGSLEYGLAYPIDAEAFPYREELQREVDAILDADSYLGLHYYTNVGATKERELWELNAHKKALQSYGIDTSRIGANQHTWHLSAASQTQSFEAMWEAGLLWNSGFEPSRSSATPQVSAENVMALPFFLTKDGQKTLLLQNCSVLTYVNEPWAEISARYGMPTCLYYHCDWMFQPDVEQEAVDKVAQLESFQETYEYNFVREDQLMLATAAAYNMTLTVEKTGESLTFTPGAAGTDFPLYDEHFQNAVGVRVSFAQTVDTETITSDADVWLWFDGELYIGLNKTVSVQFDGKNTQENHLLRVNLPARITTDEDGVTRLEFQESGMMQVKLAQPAQWVSEGWQRSEDGLTLTKYGTADTLELVL